MLLLLTEKSISEIKPKYMTESLLSPLYLFLSFISNDHCNLSLSLSLSLYLSPIGGDSTLSLSV